MGLIMVVMGILLIGCGVWIIVIASGDKDYEYDGKYGKEYVDEEMLRDIREMIRELGGDEEE